MFAPPRPCRLPPRRRHTRKHAHRLGGNDPLFSQGPAPSGILAHMLTREGPRAPLRLGSLTASTSNSCLERSCPNRNGRPGQHAYVPYCACWWVQVGDVCACASRAELRGKGLQRSTPIAPACIHLRVAWPAGVYSIDPPRARTACTRLQPCLLILSPACFPALYPVLQNLLPQLQRPRIRSRTSETPVTAKKTPTTMTTNTRPQSRRRRR